MPPADAIFELSPALLGLALLAAIIIGFAKTGIAGAGILVVPIMAAIFPAGKSTGILLPMLIAGDLFAVAYYRRHAEWRHIGRTLPYAVLGILVGWWAQSYFRPSDLHLKRLIGGIVLAVILIGAWASRQKNKGELQVPQRWWFAAGAGLLGGFATMTANAAGPVWMVYLLAMRLPKVAFIGTSAWLYLILNTFKLPFSYNLGYISWDSLLFNLKLVPAIGLGALIGIKTLKIVPQKGFDWAVKILTVAAAAYLLAS